eukprot:TRINITY_DN1642_c0_g1_i3.p1 TRINITY_DN1642_c0_g1~~TRINITY_DN1642_c0_g1_i3.p1  ORF type:complete len:429 (-),score=134.30 TRINITY_DN1642_c0_g1_i3:242-1528(-)
MGSKGRVPPHLRRPLPGPGMIHPDPFGPAIHPPLGPHPFDMLPPPELMEQKMAAQHVEMERLAMENQRLAATHSTLRHELAAAQQELQRLQAHFSAMRADKEKQMRGLLDKIAKMEADLQAVEPVKMELQQARADAQSLIAGRQELILKVQQLTHDLQRTHMDTQQVPALISELEGLRQEYQHYRVTYDYEKKLYNDHLESLQVMEKNYISMAREVEKLRAELANAANLESSGGAYVAATGYKENDVSGYHAVVPSAYEESYGVQQGRAPSVGTAQYGGGTGPPAWAGYDAPRGPGYDAQRAPSYDAARGHGYDAARGAGYDAARGTGYEALPRGGTGPQAQVPSGNVVPYGSSQTSPHAGGNAVSRGLSQTPTRAGGGNAVPYGSSQTPTHAGGNPVPYGSSQTTASHPGGGYDVAKRGASAARRGA